VDTAKCAELYDELCKPSGQNGTGEAKLSEDINDVVQCAYEQAVEWGHQYIGAEHLLVGIILAGKGLGFEMLNDLGITQEKVSDEIQKLIVCINEKNERKEK